VAPPGPAHASELLACIKRKFATEKLASEAGRRWHQNAYHCRKCKLWHLTKQRRPS
jgi:hypothetical protein